MAGKSPRHKPGQHRGHSQNTGAPCARGVARLAVPCAVAVRFVADRREPRLVMSAALQTPALAEMILRDGDRSRILSFASAFHDNRLAVCLEPLMLLSPHGPFPRPPHQALPVRWRDPAPQATCGCPLKFAPSVSHAPHTRLSGALMRLDRVGVASEQGCLSSRHSLTHKTNSG